VAINSFWQRAKFSCNGKSSQFFCEVAQKPDLGRKTAIHEFPDSIKSRYVEDTGEKSPIYVLNIFIEANNNTGTSYKRNKKKFEEVMSQKGIGVLIHPTEGKKKVVVVQCQLTSEQLQGEIGRVQYQVTFAESDKNKFPEGVNNEKSLLNEFYKLIGEKNAQLLKDAIEGANELAETYNEARDAIDEVTNTINDVIGFANGIVDEVAGVVADINEFMTSINSLMQLPGQLIGKLSNIFESVLNAFDNFTSNIKNSERIFNSIQFSTNSSKNAVATYTKIACLSNAMQASSQVDYTNQEQIDSMIKRLDKMYFQFEQNKIDDELYSYLENARLQNIKLLNSLKLKLPNIKVIDVKESTPAVILTYQYYGSETASEYQNIIDLNNPEDSANLKGKINIFL
jgi:prophage DNA circulation protein